MVSFIVQGLHRINTEVQLREFTALWIRLQGIHLSDGEDQIQWRFSASGNYSAASAYTTQFLGTYSDINFAKLWKSKVQPKCKLFIWLWLRQRILTDDKLAVRGLDHGTACVFCDQEEETATHLGLDCPFARSVWALLAHWTDTPNLLIQRLQFSSPAEWWEHMTTKLSKDELMVAIYGVWHIWKERCRRIFQQAALSEQQLVDLLRDDMLLLGTHLARQTAPIQEPEPDGGSDNGE